MEIEKKQNQKWIPGKLIGRGSYGSVYIGVRESDGDRFAVKSVSKESVSSMEELANEIEIVQSLSSSSPFIVEYYGNDETASCKNLHMEYLEGGDVAKAGMVSDVELIRSYTWCLVMALKEVHSKGIVHCDVKGSNVLVGSASGVVKLSDFGSAKIVVNDDQDCNQRVKIVPRGSPLWMAPEVVRGESQGWESDIWSLGCTVIEMFTGVPAWQDRGAHTLFQIGYSNDLPEYQAQLPELARDFLNKCLNRNPEQRWSCDQLLQHPFLLPVPSSKITTDVDSTPRSILDWQNLDFSDDDYEDDDHDQEFPSTSFQYDEIDEESAKDRIRNLATTSGVNWESDGWVEVRSLTSHSKSNKKQEQEHEQQEQSISAGTSLEYAQIFGDGKEVNSHHLPGVELEVQDNDYLTWINLRVDDNDNDNDDEEEEEIISGGDGVERCGNGDSSGGVNLVENKNHKLESYIKAVEFSLLLMLFSSFLLLHVLYSSSSRNKIIQKENQCYIVLQFFWLHSHKFLVMLFQVGVLEQVVLT